MVKNREFWFYAGVVLLVCGFALVGYGFWGIASFADPRQIPNSPHWYHPVNLYGQIGLKIDAVFSEQPLTDPGFVALMVARAMNAILYVGIFLGGAGLVCFYRVFRGLPTVAGDGAGVRAPAGKP